MFLFSGEWICRQNDWNDTIVVTKIFYNFLFEVSCVYLHVDVQIMPHLKSELHFWKPV